MHISLGLSSEVWAQLSFSFCSGYLLTLHLCFPIYNNLGQCPFFYFVPRIPKSKYFVIIIMLLYDKILAIQLYIYILYNIYYVFKLVIKKWLHKYPDVYQGVKLHLLRQMQLSPHCAWDHSVLMTCAWAQNNMPQCKVGDSQGCLVLRNWQEWGLYPHPTCWGF